MAFVKGKQYIVHTPSLIIEGIYDASNGNVLHFHANRVFSKTSAGGVVDLMIVPKSPVHVPMRSVECSITVKG